jgi:hypothetical protein
MPTRNALVAAGASAAVAWAALILQLVLMVVRIEAQGHGLAFALWRYFGYFTIFTNCGVAIVASAMALRPAGRLAGPRARLVAACAIVVVAIVYSVALRHAWRPEGWQTVADHALHDLTPLCFLIAWLLFPHGSLRWRDGLWTTVPALAYCAYTFSRGAVDGWYPYYFLDPTQLPLVFLLSSIAILFFLFLAVGLLLTAVDRAMGRRGGSAPS